MKILEVLLNIFSGIDVKENHVFLNKTYYKGIKGKAALGLNLGREFKPGFLSMRNINNNIELLQTLIRYMADPSYLVCIDPKGSYWKVVVYHRMNKIYTGKIIFTDNSWYTPTFLLKRYFNKKYDSKL